MRELITEFAQKRGQDGPAELAITLARRHFDLLDSVAQALDRPVETLLEASEWR